MRKLARAEIGVLVFNVAYLAIGLTTSLQRDNAEFLMYFVVLCLLIAVVAAIHFRIGLPLAALWGLSVWGLVHLAGGLFHVPESLPTAGDSNVLYNLWIIPRLLKFDQLVHAYGFGLVTWICWLGIRAAFLNRGVQVTPTLGLLTLSVAGGMGFGAANEMVEFFATLTVPETNVGGYENTGWDLVANCVGSVVAAGMIYAWKGHDPLSGTA